MPRPPPLPASLRGNVSGWDGVSQRPLSCCAESLTGEGSELIFRSRIDERFSNRGEGNRINPRDGRDGEGDAEKRRESGVERQPLVADKSRDDRGARAK